MNPTFTIFIEASSSRIVKSIGDQRQWATVDLPSGLGNSFPPGDTIAAALRQLNYQGEGILLALPPHWCLCAWVSEAGLRRRSREAALGFRLEEQLPLALEEMVADFISSEGGSLGIAVQGAPIKRLVDELEACGVVVVSICPTALLIVHQWLIGTNVNGLDGLLFALNGRWDFFQFDQGRIRSWASLSQEPTVIRSQILQARRGRAERLRIGVAGAGQDAKTVLEKIPGLVIIDESSDDVLELAARAADKISREGSPLVELRRGALAPPDSLYRLRTPLQAALASVAALSVCFALAMFWRASEYNRLSRVAREQQEQAFREALPSQSIPPLITSRLQSEEKRLRGLSGMASTMPPSLSILPLLQNTLAGLPVDLRFTLLELQFEPQRLYIEGQTLDHGAADQIAAGLRRTTGFAVDPPHTEQPTGEDVTFTISAAPVAALAADKMGKGQ